MENVVHLSNHTPHVQEGPIEPPYKGDVYVALSDGDRVPVGRLLREALTLVRIAEADDRTVFVDVHRREDARAFVEALNLIAIETDEGFEINVGEGRLVVKWDA